MQASGSIVLSKLTISNDQYQIITSAEDIVRFQSKNSAGERVFETSPRVLKIDLYKNGVQIDFKGKYILRLVESTLEKSYEWTEEEGQFIHFGEIGKDEEGNSALVNPRTLYFEIQNLVQSDSYFQSSPHIFIFEYKENNNVIVSKAFQFRDGVSTEMAEFNINAAAINASIRDSQMSFTEDGLEIKNGDLKIYQKTAEEEVQVFGFETKQIGDQSISKLTVRGAIYADEGEFTGSIHATDAQFDGGTIGGFKIEKDRLISLKSQNNEDEEIPYLTLDGENGRIIAEYIDLGQGAKITDHIQLGNAYIYNPEKNNKKLIESGGIVIKDNGTAKIGDIELKGNKSEIWGENWSIRKDSANFSNVNVSGAIETAVFKTNSVQAAGGAMIFRPSYKGNLNVIGDILYITLEDEFLGNVGSKVQIVHSATKKTFTGTIVAIEGFAVSVSSEDFDKDLSGNCLIIDYSNNEYLSPNEYYPIEEEIYYQKEEGETESEYVEVAEINEIFEAFSISEKTSDFLSSKNIILSQKDNSFLSTDKTLLARKDSNLVNSIKNYYVMGETLLFGLNSGNVGVGWEGRILPKGLTLTSFKKRLYEPNLYLGDLKQIGLSGYGLYADNVFLNGSLTTQVDKNNYAGINTLNGVRATVFGENFEKNDTPIETDTSKIVFWAGASSKEDEDIQKAYFQVTENGSIYAQRAKLVDTLMVGGALQATEIHTADLYGTESGLNIHDGSRGIRFLSQDEDVLFSITQNGIGNQNQEFIKINDGEVNFIGSHLRTRNNENFLQLTTLTENGGVTTPVLQHIEGNNTCGFYFEKSNTSFKMDQKIIQKWNVNGTVLYNNLELTNQNVGLNYKAAEGGYDLYVVV